MISWNYRKARFTTSILDIHYLPTDSRIEVAFMGFSNVGKSSALNTLTNQKHLARTSKKPGSTKLINLFEVTEGIRLIDFPGYGYTHAPRETKQIWQYQLEKYLKTRFCLKGIILLMDVRYPFKKLDWKIINQAIVRKIPILILLTKADKLSMAACSKQINMLHKKILVLHPDSQLELFSSKTKQGLRQLQEKLDSWCTSLNVRDKNKK